MADNKNGKSSRKRTNNRKRRNNSNRNRQNNQNIPAHVSGKTIEDFSWGLQQTGRQFRDPARTTSSSSQKYSKENLRSYYENVNQNEKNFRAISRYLYDRSQTYKKIIEDNTSLINPNYRQIILNPVYKSLDSLNVDDKALKTYFETIDIVEHMNLPTELKKIYRTCWIEDTCFAVYFYEDTGGLIYTLDPNYCKIVGVYDTGDFSFAFDCSYFASRQEEMEALGEPFTSMYKAYQADQQNGRWQLVPEEYSVCMKVNTNNYQYSIPPYITLFSSLINLEDLKEIQAIADEETVYKLLKFQIPLISGAKTHDEFAVALDTAIRYYMKAIDALPDNVGGFLTPVDVDTIDFNNDPASDVNKIENANKNILSTSGHSVTSALNGTTSTKAAILADEDYVISSLLPQTEAWVNRFISYKLKNAAKVRFMHVTRFTREDFKNSIQKDMNYGLPMAMALGALNGFNEKEMIMMAKTNEALGVYDLFRPMETAATRSSRDAGRPKNEVPTDEGESSENKREGAG